MERYIDRFMAAFEFEGLTFDDISLVTQYADFLPPEANLCSRFSRNVKLNIPFVSAAMAGTAGLLLARFIVRRNRSVADIVDPTPITPTFGARLRGRVGAGAVSLAGRLLSTLVVGAVSKAVLRRSADR